MRLPSFPCAFAALLLLLLAVPASAQKVKLGDASADMTGQETLDLAELSVDPQDLEVSIVFASSGPRTFLAFDDRGTTFSGTYKRTGPDGRKLLFDVNKASKKELKGSVKEFIAEEANADEEDVSVKIEKLKIKGKIIKELQGETEVTRLRLQAKIRGQGKVSGIKSEATYRFDVTGPLETDP